jgi:argininosuccinate lyase
MDLTEIPLEKLRDFSEVFDEDVTKLYSWEQAISSRTVKGGTGWESVRAQIEEAEKIIGKT